LSGATPFSPFSPFLLISSSIGGDAPSSCLAPGQIGPTTNVTGITLMTTYQFVAAVIHRAGAAMPPRAGSVRVRRAASHRPGKLHGVGALAQRDSRGSTN